MLIFFLKKKLENFNNFYFPFRNFLSISRRSINKDIELLKENIKTILNTQETYKSDIDKKKIFIEKNIDYSNVIKNYTIGEKIMHKEKFIKINEEISKIENISKKMNSTDNSAFILSLLGKYYEKKGTKILVLKNKEPSFKKIEIFSIQSLFSLINQKNMNYILILGKKQTKKY